MQRQYKHLLINAALAFGGLVIILFMGRFGFYSDVMIIVFFSGMNLRPFICPFRCGRRWSLRLTIDLAPEHRDLTP